MFDLNSLDTAKVADQGVTLEVRHPATGAVLMNGDGRAATLTLLGNDSERARRADQAAINRRFKASSRRKIELTAEELESDEIEKLAACTLAWNGFVVDGQELECTPENARRLYQRYRWLREQAAAFMDDRANFLNASPPS